MRREIVKAIFMKELRECLRDRRSLIMMFGIPLVLYPLLVLGLGKLVNSRAAKEEEQRYAVLVVNPNAAPQLLHLMQAEDSGLDLVHNNDSTHALASHYADALLILPDGLQTKAIEGDGPPIRIELDRSRTESNVIERKLQHVIREYEQWIIAQRLARYDAPESVLTPIPTTTVDVATGTQRLGRFLAGMLPVLLLMTGMLGAFFPALNATTTERESGTLEALLVTPARKIELLVGKGALVLLSSFVTAALNLVSMSLVMWRVLSMSSRDLGEMTISPGALALTYLASIPTLIFFTALVMIVGLFARSFREANSYATPVMLLPMLAMIISLAEPPTTRGLLVTPVLNTAAIIHDVLTSRATVGAFVLAFVSSCLYAGLMLSAAARIFTSERLVSPTWEPLSIRGLRRSAGGQRRIPAIDEAMVLFAVVLLLLFYVSPFFAIARFGQYELYSLLVGNELLLIAAPALLFAWLGRYRWREVFSFRRAPLSVWASGILMGAGLALSMDLLSVIQAHFWKPDSAATAQFKIFVDPLRSHPVVTVVLAGLLAGVCEEILFRGTIQAALRNRLRFWPTVLVGSLLFAGLHLDLYGLPLRMLISVFLAWLVYRSGSIFPAMLMHGLYDCTQLGLAARLVHRLTPGQIATYSPPLNASFWLRVGIGLVLLFIGWALCRFTREYDPHPA